MNPSQLEQVISNLREFIFVDIPRQQDRELLQNKLGEDRNIQKRRKPDVTNYHTKIATQFNSLEAPVTNDIDVLKHLEQVKETLGYLLSIGSDGTVLHVLLDPETYSSDSEPSQQGQKPINFKNLQPIIQLILKLQPRLPETPDADGKTPLFMVIESNLGITEKQDILEYFCENIDLEKQPWGLESILSSRKSLVHMTFDKGPKSVSCHAIHKAVETDVKMDEKLILSVHEASLDAFSVNKSQKKQAPNNTDRRGSYIKPESPSQLSHLTTVRPRINDKRKSGLAKLDSKKRTCLHIALSRPWTPMKVEWAKKLVNVQPDLLQVKPELENEIQGRTPLQHFLELRGPKHMKESGDDEKKVAERGQQEDFERSSQKTTVSSSYVTQASNEKLDELEYYMKRLCLNSFSNPVAKEIMYTRKTMREVSLAFQQGDTVSGESLKRLKTHYKADNILRYVFIPRIFVEWDSINFALRQDLLKWRCVGRTDLLLIFKWLKSEGVKAILEIVVDDFETDGRRSHSDDAIFACLTNIRIEKWDWRRLDISSDLIRRIAGDHIREVHLYCSGLQAVLQSWSSIDGLPQLKNLDKVFFEIDQGLESIETIKRYANEFQSKLKSNFSLANENRTIEVECKEINSATSSRRSEHVTSSKVKDEGDEGFEEQDWLKCMDEFAAIVDQLDETNKGHVKVALIDDGVRSNYAGLDNNIATGASFFGTGKGTNQQLSQTYNTSLHGHGTVMAYYIRRVCPKVKLCVAKLDGKSNSRGVSFKIESATAAIEWAISEEVDIICMAWAIDKQSNSSPNEEALKHAIQKAANRNIPMFCANPDKGRGYESREVYPKSADHNVFSIGAATSDGNRWQKISPDDNTVDYFLPGVELGIPVQTNNKERVDRPPTMWEIYSGSSVSCALAVGLAAMILHVANITGVTDDEYKWLKEKNGMEAAFGKIHKTADKWLPVRLLFGKASLQSGSEDQRRDALKREVMGRILSARDVGA